MVGDSLHRDMHIRSRVMHNLKIQLIWLPLVVLVRPPCLNGEIFHRKLMPAATVLQPTRVGKQGSITTDSPIMSPTLET